MNDPVGGTIDAAVADVKDNYKYWYDLGYVDKPNIGAVGTATYEAYQGNFMFLFADNYIWIALNDASYDAEWAAGTVWSSGRDYDVLGGPGSYGF